MTASEYWIKILGVVYPLISTIELILFVVLGINTLDCLAGDDKLSSRIKWGWYVFIVFALFLIGMEPLVETYVLNN